MGFFDIFRKRYPLSRCKTAEWVVFGIGNFPRKYHGTRHNVGFQCIDTLVEHLNSVQRVQSTQLNDLLWAQTSSGCPIVCAKPRTYVNRCGMAFEEVCDICGVSSARVVTVVDDCNLDTGAIRMRLKGSAGGHNGLKSIIAYAGSDFARIRIGIGQPAAGQDRVEFVLGTFTQEENERIENALQKCSEGIELLCSKHVHAAMNMLNNT